MGISTVGVIGLGYIGLPTAAILAANGVAVTGVDVSPTTVTAVNRGEVPFVEPDLAGYVAEGVSSGKLRAVAAPEPADAYIVAVPTPFMGDHKPDLSYIRSAAEAIAPTLRGGELVILESTSPPGTTRHMADWILAERPDLSLDGSGGRPVIYVAHCPERVLPGRIMVELVTNDRIVGGITPEAAQRARDLYQVFCQGEILLTDAATAEAAKLVENSFRDVNIAFANELSLVADKLGIDVWELIRLANHHPRVNILQPGPGVGGHCIAVDPWFLVDAAPEEARLIRTAREVNDAKPRWVLHKVLDAVAGIESPVVAAYGLAFKPNIDDLRESPAVEIVRDMAATFPQAKVLVVEPHVDSLPAELEGFDNVRLVEAEEALEAGDVQVLLVDHAAFRGLSGRLVEQRLVDTRGMTAAGRV
ncbi:UDP-N-acetyl-D-mannosaminuronic acid dehydrogenase [Promicromonospora umidemergens]|uniref:UDP-N-acetyl-D-mannosamine dehydrogenase n=1 Tax=Promicromonospora umidemergens TaxID=629679 RepID=A0ABP8WMZ1_9MICO|nr:UDP-N-acetyl-D-mannosamine dehydrogenase [Promicromonospora umidemergens]MCP2283142.1 UDP-N-acetyl-D-mannosaminuronic acid dehydrogenase [Promicromonospora umidemergens]